jgi:hypothetical protein
MEREHEKYERLIARCKSLPPTPTAVAHPCDESSHVEEGLSTPDTRSEPGKEHALCGS